jgi:hypothetical protein
MNPLLFVVPEKLLLEQSRKPPKNGPFITIWRYSNGKKSEWTVASAMRGT